jgi:rubrerythrin
MAFVHFEYWNTNNPACQHLIERIQDPAREARVVYEDPYYWLVLPNHNDSASNMYNSYNMRREINHLNDTIEHMQREYNNVNNVLETLLSDFYEIPQRGAETENAAMPQATMPQATMPQATMPQATMPQATMPQAAMPQAAMPQAAMPQAANESSSSFLPSSNFDRIRQEQSEELVCPVCSLMLPSHATQCPACEAPLNADEKLLKVLTTKPEDTSPEGIEDGRKNALNKINDFIESENNKEDPDDKPNNTESQGWAASWFSN